jgi:hypothetical protein
LVVVRGPEACDIHDRMYAGYRTGSLFGEPIVAWGVWVPLVTLTEFFQTTRGEVVERLLRPVSSIREVKPFDKVKNAAVISASSLDT